MSENIKNKIIKSLYNNMVTLIFAVLCLIGIIFSGQPLSFITGELLTRIGRNSFLVLSLIVPVLAGMGLNFGIIIGAMAGQIAIIAVTHWGVTGLPGLLLCVLLCTPIAVLFGFFTGRLLNKTKGQEMIASMIMGYFANGLYQLLFLFLIGTLIPMKNPVLVLHSGIGIKNTIDLSGGIKYALDYLVRFPLFSTIIAACWTGVLLCLNKHYKNMKNLFISSTVLLAVLMSVLSYFAFILGNNELKTVFFLVIWITVLYLAHILFDKNKVSLILSLIPILLGIYYLFTGNTQNFTNLLILAILSLVSIKYLIFVEKNNKNKKHSLNTNKYLVYAILLLILSIGSCFIMNSRSIFRMIKLPVVTFMVIGSLCLFTILIVKTKIGQDFRTVGQDRHIAAVAGIKVNKVRVIAIIISTVLAAWGQLIFLQNLGTLNTYGSHEQIGMFAIAALLIGGASVSKATIGQAILGTILFHTLFIVSPQAGKNLFGDAQIGEHFRVFVAYGVIGVSLGLHAWKKHLKGKLKLKSK